MWSMMVCKKNLIVKARGCTVCLILGSAVTWESCLCSSPSVGPLREEHSACTKWQSILFLAGELPLTVELKVVEAEPYAKGDSATSSYIQCTVENGARVAVPPYVQPGETIVVDTGSGAFVKRAT